jgi:hypothetical protein
LEGIRVLRTIVPGRIASQLVSPEFLAISL